MTAGRQRLTADPTPSPTLVYDVATRAVVDASPAACALYGYERAELVGLPIEALRPAEDVPAMRERLDGTDRDGAVRRDGVRHRRRDGTVFYVSLESHPIEVGDRALRMVFLRDSTVPGGPAARVERQALLFRGTRDAVVFTDPEGVVLDWNPAAERLWGWTRDEVLGRRLDFLHPGDEAGRVVGTILSALEAEGRWEGSLETVARDGAPRHAEVRVLPIHDAEGRIVATVGINRDVTEQRRAEHTLLETAQGLRVLGDQIPHILWVADAEGGVRYLNSRWERVTGQPVEAGLGTGWLAALHPDDVDMNRRAWGESLATGSDFAVEHRIISQDGEARWYLTRGTAIRGPSGHITRWFGSSVEIHAQKTTEAAIRRREAYFRSVFEHAHDAIVLFDEETGRVVDGNPAAEELYGYDRASLLELSLKDLYDQVDGPADYLKELEDRVVGSHVVTQRTRSGDTLHVEMNATLMEHQGGRVILTINRDMTDRLRLEERLRQAQKMEAVGRLAGGLAHDFNNLTTAIQGFAGLLAERIPPGDEAREALDEIDRAAARATDLTRQLLAYTRQQVMRGRVLDLNEVVKSSRQLIARLIGEDIEIHTDLASSLHSVRADPGQLNQVLMNLAVNARDAMTSGGKLTINTSNVVLDREFADRHPPTAPGSYVRLRIQDTGHGMTSEARAHAFEPFFTTKPVGEGTGLGLATVYGIIKQSGGYIWLESAPDEGTTIDIYLPRVEERPEESDRAQSDPGVAASGAANAPDPSPAAGPERRTVLLVEDEEGVRRLARRVLERAGYEVLTAEDGMEALEVAGSASDTIHLVLTDIVMPRMSGKELAGEMALTHPETRVLYMSGYTGETLAERGDLTRTDVVLEKPFRPAELVDAVGRMLQTEVE